MAIKNYLKDVKEITAPLNWKSSPDSPPTQLAYVTKPEIDLLVKANLHGSMNGKPNKGPKGIISLDGFGVDDEDSVVSQAQQKQFNQNLQNLQESGQQGQYQVNTSQSSFDQPGAVIPTEFQKQYQMEQDQDKPIPGVSFGDQMGVTLTPEQAKQIKKEKELAETSETFREKVMKKLMGGGDDGDLDLTKEEAYADLPAGMHPLRKQYEYLAKKYGEGWKNTTQAKVLEGYLSGVPVERGGGLGARDDTYGGGEFAKLDQFGNPIDPEKFEVAEKFRQQLLNSMGLAGSDIGGMNTMGTVAEQLGALSEEDYNKLRYGLSADQFFNFNQQLMAADPSAGNEAYKAARPFSSGDLTSGLGQFIPGVGAAKTFLSGFLPERDLSGFENYADYEQAGAAFRPLPVPDQNNQTGPIRPPGFMPIIPLPDPSQPERPKYPLPTDPVRPPFMPPFMPKFPTGIETVFDLGPSFRGSPYTNRGVSPAFYEALSRFA